MAVEQAEGAVTVQRPTDRGEHRALHGLTRSLIANMVAGVTDGFEKRLEIQGVGYRAQLKGRNLEMALGYSHPVSIEAPEGIEFEVPQPTEIVVRGIDKQLVGPGRRGHPQAPPAGALQGQGHPLPRRARAAQGREEGLGDDRPDQQTAPPAPPPPRPRPGHRDGRAARASPFTAPTAASSPSSSTTSRGHTLAAVNWIEPELRKLTATEQAKRAGRAARRAGQGGRRRELRLRPRRLPVPRPRQGARRRRPRGGFELLTATVGDSL